MTIHVLAVPSAQAFTRHNWRVSSPDRHQTFAYGTESDRKFADWRGHLALLLTYTNDPFVDRMNWRQWDNFRFDFPQIKRDKDFRTFYFVAADGRHIPVAEKRPDFLGINEVKLLPTSQLVVNKVRGLVTVSLLVTDPASAAQ